MYNVTATGGKSGSITGVPFGSNGGGIVGSGTPEDPYREVGTSGLEAFSGFVSKAYNSELFWPTVYPLYNRLRRSDPEITVIRQIFNTVVSSVRIEFDLPEKPSDDDKRFQEFGNQVLEDLDGGIQRWRDTFVSYVPFMAWAWWEAVPGVRKSDWVPPDENDEWRSQFNDGLIGFRRLAFRDHSSWQRWDLDDYTGRLRGMWQLDIPNPLRRLPLERSVHVTFGDVNNPEGLSPLEAVWRLERIKYGLEVVQGIGFEHAAGHLSVTKTVEGQLDDTDKANVRAAARAILTAQEGNYAAWPFGFTGAVIDVPFSAAPALLSAIQYYSVLKLAVYNMQFIGMSTISNTGSYAALKDSTALWLVAFNSMVAGGVAQLDKQMGERLLTLNKASFPGITKRPKLKSTSVEKLIDLAELATFMSAMKGVLPLGDEDYIEVRRRSGFLPETLPTVPESTPVADATGVTNPDGTPAAQDNTPPTPPANPDATTPPQDNTPPSVPDAGQLAKAWGAARVRYVELVANPALANLAQRKRELTKRIFSELQADFDSTRSDYRDTIYTAVLSYLVQGGAGSRTFANAIKRNIAESFPDAFYEGYVAGGGETVAREDDAWLTAKISGEMGFVDLMFESLKGLKDQNVAPGVYTDEADRRADGYARTLDAVYAEGRLRGAGNIMLTWSLGATEEHCRTCTRLDGSKHSARWYASRGFIPGRPGAAMDCGGWNCKCSLTDGDGNVWSVE